jgi:hypothetical protein
VFLRNNDSATASMSYSGNAASLFPNLPSSLGANQTYSASTFTFTGTLQLCATATASGKTASSQICSTQVVN